MTKSSKTLDWWRRWIQGVQVGLQLGVAQAKLCRAVFDSPYAEAAFDEIVAKQTADLTKFGRSILQSRRAPEKVRAGLLSGPQECPEHSCGNLWAGSAWPARETKTDNVLRQ